MYKRGGVKYYVLVEGQRPEGPCLIDLKAAIAAFKCCKDGEAIAGGASIVSETL